MAGVMGDTQSVLLSPRTNRITPLRQWQSLCCRSWHHFAEHRVTLLTGTEHHALISLVHHTTSGCSHGVQQIEFKQLYRPFWQFLGSFSFKH